MSSINDLIGKQLGRYRIVEHLATGGMAEIFLARQEAEGGFKKELVLKVLKSSWEENSAVVDLFMGEARIAALMNHPNIVDVYDVASENGRHFIAMEHIPGKTLTEVAKRAIQVTKSIPIEVGIFIGAEIAGALAHLYEGTDRNGQPFHVVHRDISPTNVLISTAGQVKLIDFGIARQGVAVIEASGARPGKVTYMSPEQVKGTPIDGRSDIFCLGTILYEITLGRRLWRGPREVAAKRIVEERPKPPTYVRHDYPAELELIVLRTLEKRPEDRYQSPTELYHDLQSFMERSSTHLRNNFQMADYAAKIYSEEAESLISEAGRERADAFVEGNESAEADYENLDFDRQQVADGPGAVLARALRSATVRQAGGVPTLQPEPPEVAAGPVVPPPMASSGERPAGGKSQPRERPEPAPSLLPAAKAELKAEAKAADKERDERECVAGTSSKPSAEAAESLDGDAMDNLPRRWRPVVVVAILLVAAVALGALWALYGS
jgi:serine/threonine-protein kinase